MKKNKVIILLQLLDKKEFLAFKSVMKNAKRKRLFKLLETLEKYISKKKNVDIEAVFQALYNEKYSPGKNYLLRNEMRLLSIELKSFLIEKEIQQQFSEDPAKKQSVYLEALFRRGELTLFEAEKRKLEEIVLSENHFEIAELLAGQEVELMITKKGPTVPNIRYLGKVLDTRKRLLSQAYLTELADIEYKKGYTQRTLIALGEKADVTPVEDIRIDWEDVCKNNKLVHFKLLHHQSFSLSGEEKINILNKALDVLPLVVSPNFNRNEWTASTYQRIAQEYFFMGDNHSSRQFYKKALTYREGVPKEKLAPYIFNFMTNELRGENYSEALQVIEDNEDLLLGSAIVRERTLCMKAICSIFLNEYEKAENCIPQKLKAGGMQTYFYLRLIQIIIFFKRNEIELALTEAENVMQSVYYNNDSSFRNFTNQLYYFLKLQINKVAKSNYKTLMKNRLSELSGLGNWGMNQHTLLYRWLINEYNFQLD